ncbi:MAG: hypothetical protein HKN70_07390 [Gammaproteobacteria bacterium]|nr:hypothetical protein [Gammaproteobacteria bacterium]
MATSARLFARDLYEEHLEEAGFLSEQRASLLFDPEISWRDIKDFESRLEAHLDALVIGKNLALEVCRAKVMECDPWELNTIVRVFCRQRRKDYVFKLLSSVDTGDVEISKAIAHALRQEAPPAWQEDLIRVLQGSQNYLDGIIGHVAGYRRFPAAAAISKKLVGQNYNTLRELIWALGRVGDDTTIPKLREMLTHDNAEVCSEAALALSRLGDSHPMRSGLMEAQLKSWPRYCLGVAGNKQAVSVLLDILKSGKPDVDVIQSLGLLGDLSAVTPLLDVLGHEELGATAAIALNTITGASLQSEIFVADKFDEEELFEEEREVYEREGKLPSRQDKTPYGHWQTQANRGKADWRRWLTEHRDKFDRSIRWRAGMPYGPRALASSLSSTTTPNAVRGAIYEELVCRYRIPIPFEADLPVHQQERFLVQINAWANQVEPDFEAGKWYFAGQLQA